MRWLALALVGCGGGAIPCTVDGGGPSFASDVQPILAARCDGVECHRATWGGANGYARLVDVVAPECTDGRLLVAPGSPSTSYLIEKVRGVDLCQGVQMPKVGPPLTDAQIQTLSDWIC